MRVVAPQHGNNNAYCQDNELSWLDWSLDQSRRELLAFTRFVIQLFHHHPVLRRRTFFQGRRIRGSEVRDVVWFRPDGQEMSETDWENGQARSLGLRLAGDAIEEVDPRGRRIVDDTLLILLNAYHQRLPFVLPVHQRSVRWELILDTREVGGRRRYRLLRGGEAYELEGRSMALLRLQNRAGRRKGDT